MFIYSVLFFSQILFIVSVCKNAGRLTYGTVLLPNHFNAISE